MMNEEMNFLSVNSPCLTEKPNKDITLALILCNQIKKLTSIIFLEKYECFSKKQ